MLGTGVTQVARVGHTVRRTASAWTPQVHEFLRLLRAEGFTAAPEPLGFDEQGREVLTYLPGAVADDPRTEAAVVSAARLLRAFHDASARVLPHVPADGWQFPALEPAEVVVHGDFATYNLAFDGEDATGLIDFDTARPGPRWWDVAYGVYRFAPLPDVGRRARLFAEAYGLAEEEFRLLPARIATYLRWVGNMVEEQAGLGHPAFTRHRADGHHLHYFTHAEHFDGITLS